MKNKLKALKYWWNSWWIHWHPGMWQLERGNYFYDCPREYLSLGWVVIVWEGSKWPENI